MGLIIEIVLTIAAWRKGWRWYALIPLVVAGSVGFSAGFVVGAFGGTVTGLLPFLVLLDLVCIVVLIVMVAKPFGYEKAPSLKALKALETQPPVTPQRAISSYGN
ncbi:MAG: hypothetical protein HQ583_03945 [Candidatus Abyssubacteria bacterium]|nr:hypothetical protein [Candidatus Abyssubacteria bacterium]